MSFSAVDITIVGRKLYLRAWERKFFENYFLRLQKPFSRKVGEHMSPSCPPPPPSLVPTALPINADKEIFNFLSLGL